MKFSFFFIVIFILSIASCAQSVIITPGNNQASVIANSTTKPIVLPKLTANAIWSIQNPPKGTMVFDLTNNVLRSFNGTNWVRFKTVGTDIIPNSPPSARKENEISLPLSPNTQISLKQ